MDELRQIITNRLKIIAHYRQRQLEDLSPEQLIKQKRKQASRQVIESRLLQSLSNKRTESVQKAEEFYHQSFYIMKVYDFEFVYILNENFDIFQNLVQLYVAFFQRQDCNRRAEEIQHIFKKKLCEKSMLASILLNWLVEWSKKTLQTFLKGLLVEVNGKKPAKDLKLKRMQRRKQLQNQLKTHQETIKSIEKQLEYHRQPNMKKSQLLDFKNMLQIRDIGKNKINFVNEKSLNLGEEVENNEEENPTLRRKESILKNVKEFQTKQPNILVNKEILYSAFYEEISKYYRSYTGILGDLDINFLRSIRKVDRRQELKNKFLQVAKSMAKGQTQIKKSIDNYHKQYFLKFQKTQQKPIVVKAKEKEKEKEKKEEIQKKQNEEKNETVEELKEFSFQSKSKEKKKSSLEKKTLEIQLPQIKNHSKIHSKPSKLLVIQPGKHHQKHPISRKHSRDYSLLYLSSELKKEMNEESLSYRRKERISQTYNSSGRKSLDMYQRKKYDIGEVQDIVQAEEVVQTAFTKDGGVFYLPSLHKN